MWSGTAPFTPKRIRPAGIIEAVATGKIDVAIVWGPVAAI
jgi:hypothetical protein